MSSAAIVSRLRSVNPATEEVIATFEAYSPERIEQALVDGETAFRRWRRTAFAERREPMLALAGLLRARKDELGRLITREMGKPIGESLAEIEKCAWTCEIFAGDAERLLAQESVATSAGQSFVSYEPLGVVLAIMPWNFPFWQVFRFAAPAVMAGNAVLLKHSPNVCQCALTIEQLFTDAGFPAGLFRTVLLDEASLGETVPGLLNDARIAAVTVTGSDRAGRAVAVAAGRALKKSVLELGGSDPFLVLADADLAFTVEAAIRARFQNAGQSCIAAKRFIVAESIADEFEHRLIEAAAGLPVGDPLDPATRVGPLARADLRDALARQVERLVQQGARVRLGGGRIDRPGYFYQPTVVTGIGRDTLVSGEETFGPVAAVMRARDEAEAVDLANATPYGLGASIWTRDPDRALRLGRDIQSGALFVNAIVASDPRLPFGGIKQSGYGRELGSVGIREFTNVRTVWVAG